jgi:O-antigen/teichoic acid export membrane protein
VAGSLAGKAAEMATLILLATVVPRALGPVDYGHFAVPLTVVTLGSLAMTLGGPTLMARFVPAAPPRERVALARAIGSRLAYGRAVQLAVLAAVAAAAVVWDQNRFPPLATALVIAALALNVAASVGLQVGLGLGRTGAWSARYPLQNAVLVGAVLVLHGVAGPGGALTALVVSGLAAVGLAAAVVAPVLRASAAPVAVPLGAIRFGALQAAGAALVQVAHRGGVVAVAALAGSPRQTGYAALAIGIALGATYAVLQTFTVTLPHLAGTAGVSVAPAGGDRIRRGDQRSAVAGGRVSRLGATSPTARAGHLVRLSLGGGTDVGSRGGDVDSGGVSVSLGGGTDVGSRGGAAGGDPGHDRATGEPEVGAAEAVLRRLAGGLLAVIVPGTVVAAAAVEAVMPAVVGSGFRGAAAAFGPALALVVLAPLYALGVQVAALRLRPEAALANGAATAVAFLAAALVAVPPWGAAGATAAALAGGVAGIAVSARALPGAFGVRLTSASIAGAALVLLVAAVG